MKRSPSRPATHPDHGAQLPWERVRELLLTSCGAKLDAQVATGLIVGTIVEAVPDSLYGGVDLRTGEAGNFGEVGITESMVKRAELRGDDAAPMLAVDLDVPDAWAWGHIEVSWDADGWDRAALATQDLSDEHIEIVEHRALDYTGVIAALAELRDREVVAKVAGARGVSDCIEARGVLRFDSDAAAFETEHGRHDLTAGEEEFDVISFSIGEGTKLRMRRRHIYAGWLRRERILGTVDPDYLWLTVGGASDSAAWIVEEDWTEAWPRASE